MIALKDGLPVLQLASGQAVAFERDWLIRSLAQAAERAGYGKWWLAEHVAESVTAYLRDQTEVTVLSVERLTTAVRSVLQVIGYGEVGQYFEPGPPNLRISLAEIAHEAGAGYELAFFTKLGARLRGILVEKSARFELTDLESCVKLLCGRKVWNRECDILRSEIVSFTRAQMSVATAPHEVTFSLV